MTSHSSVNTRPAPPLRTGRHVDSAPPPQATSVSLAAQLLGRFTSVTQAVQRAEMQLILQEAINALDPIDREILALRHFEELSNDETAQVLGIKPSAASNRHVRALKRLRDVLKSTPGFFDKDRE